MGTKRGKREIQRDWDKLSEEWLNRMLGGRGTKRVEKKILKLKEELKGRRKKTSVKV